MFRQTVRSLFDDFLLFTSAFEFTTNSHVGKTTDKLAFQDFKSIRFLGNIDSTLIASHRTILHYDWFVSVDGNPRGDTVQGFRRREAELKAYTKVYNSECIVSTPYQYRRKCARNSKRIHLLHNIVRHSKPDWLN